MAEPAATYLVDVRAGPARFIETTDPSGFAFRRRCRRRHSELSLLRCRLLRCQLRRDLVRRHRR